LSWFAIARRRHISRSGSRLRSYRLIALALACYLQVSSSLRAQEAPAPQIKPEFQLFLNARAAIVSRCIYRVNDRNVFVGALKAIQHEMGPEFDATLPSNLERQTAPEAWTTYKETLLQLANSKNAKQSLKSLVELSLHAYCRTLDRYSSYDTYETWQKSQEFGEPDYEGAGITLLAERADDIICVPIRGGPADRAGLDAGDHLLAVNDHATHGVSLMQIHNWLAETQANSIKLRVRRGDGVVDTVTVAKEPIKFSPVSVEQSGDAWQIALHDISDRCVTDLREQLRSIGPAKTLTLDLRGCPGGPVNFAVAVASMFLPADTIVAKLETLNETETLRSNNSAPYRPAKLSILQDRYTGSAAEVIIAALLGYSPLKAQSYGEKTYGKGVTQRVVRVSGKNQKGEDVVEAGMLKITDSRIYGPNGESWDGIGLPPSSGDKD
jgi:carboxyl-terminal processing protease